MDTAMAVNANNTVSHISDTMQVVWCVLFGIESFLIIVSNITAIAIFMKKKFRIIKSCYLLINLTVADVLVGVSAFITMMEIWYSRGAVFTNCAGVFLTELSLNFSMFTLLSSLLSLAMMAFERALAVIVPFRFRRVGDKPYFIAMLFSWSVSLTLFLRHLACSTSQILNEIIKLYSMAFVLASILVIIISYASIAIKKISSHEIISSISMRNNLRLTRTLMVTTLVALVTWIPSYMILSVSGHGKEYNNTGFAMVMLIYSNSLLNLLVYTIRMPHFRRELKKMLGCNNKVGQSGVDRTSRTQAQSVESKIECDKGL